MNHTVRLAAAPLTAVLALGACGDDDAETTSLATNDATAAATADDNAPAESDIPPSFDDVGRADFMHTIVAGDFLRSIADRYGVEIDDIVSANRWEDGRDHLLLPGNEIYLPADAELPAGPTAAPSESGGSRPEAAPADASSVCAIGQMADVYGIEEGDTLEAVATRLGVAVADLEVANAFGVTGKPAFGEIDTIWVPCTANWPANVAFSLLVDPPVCDDESIQGTYEYREGETMEEVAARWMIPVELLVDELIYAEGVTTPQDPMPAGMIISVCMSWFE